MNLSLTVLTALLATATAQAATSVPVTVKEGEQAYLGSLVLPDNAKGSLPLVVVVHEWWGKTDYPEMRAKKLADEFGYAALVVDLYGNAKTADNPDGAGALATPFYKNPELGVKRLREFIAAAPEASKQAQVSLDLNHIAAIGYCFGGTQALNLARSGSLPEGQNLVAVASFHGGLASTLKAKAPISSKLLILHGAADPLVNADEVKAFKLEMKTANANLTFKAYPGALHAFTNPKATELGKKYKMPIAYNAKADQDSWLRLKAFLKKAFGK